jgi:outer membrane protein TolC
MQRPGHRLRARAGRILVPSGRGLAGRRYLFILCVLLSGPLGPLGAQTVANDTLHLSLAGVLARGRAEHPLARASGALVSAAEARAAALKVYENPRLEIDRTTFRELDNLRLVQAIRWPAEGRALSGLGLAQIASARADSTGQQRNLALELAQRYSDALRQSRMVALAVEAESLAQRAVERAVAARQLVQTGDLTVLEVQVSLDEARRARRGAESERHASGAALAILLGYDSERPVVFEDDLPLLAPAPAPDSLLGRALAADPESARWRSEVERATREVDLARARRWPQIELGPAANIGDSVTVGLTLGLSLPFWNRQSAAMRAAAADRGVALAQLEGRRRELAASVLEALSTLARVEGELGMLRSGELARAQQAALLAGRALEQGGPYLSVWLTARQAYLDARRAELDLEWQAAGARLLLNHLAGTLSAEDAP